MTLKSSSDSPIGRSQIVLKIVDRPSWEKARLEGAYRGSADDVRDGFIHLSSPVQARGTVEKFFAGRGDLLLVALDAARLGSFLRWEPSRGGELFPHVYGPLDLGAVLWEKPLPLDGGGRHIFPEEIGA